MSHAAEVSTSVDVVIPVRDREHTIARAVNSVLGQSFRELSLYVVNDGSTDGTEEVLDSFSDSRMHVLTGPRRGAGAARNLGARAGSSEFLVFLDSDDEADPDWLRSLLRSRGGAHLVCCAGRVLRPGSEDWVRSPWDGGRQRWQPLFLPGLFLLSRALFEAAGGYEERLRFGENTELGWRVMDQLRGGSGVQGTSRVLVDIHQPADGVSLSSEPARLLESAELILDIHGQRLASAPHHLASYHAIAGHNALALGRVEVARRHYDQAIQLRPGAWRYWLRFAQAHVLPRTALRRG